MRRNRESLTREHPRALMQPSLLRMLHLALEEFEIGQRESREMGSTLDYVVLSDQVQSASPRSCISITASRFPSQATHCGCWKIRKYDALYMICSSHSHYWSFLTVCIDLCRQTLLCNLYVRGWDAEAHQPTRDSVGMGIDHASQSFISLFLYNPFLSSHRSTHCARNSQIGFPTRDKDLLPQSPSHSPCSSISNNFATTNLVITWSCGRMDIDGDGLETYDNGTIVWTGVTSCSHLKQMKLDKAFRCGPPALLPDVRGPGACNS
jgi:hypothetical protein